MITDDLRRAVATLTLEPRARVWTSLTYCVLDAVWSIGARYDAVVVPLVRRVAAARGDLEPTAGPEQLAPTDPFPLDELWNAPGVRVTTMAQLQPGDLVFFAHDLGDPSTIFHVAMSLGGDAMIEAPQTGDVVKIEQRVSQSSYWAPKFIGGLRLAN